MNREFQQIEWDRQLEADWQRLLDLAVAEDLGSDGDLTTNALVSEDAWGRAAVVARRPGVLAGMPAAPSLLARFDTRLRLTAELEDGQPLAVGQRIGLVEGPARGLLAGERLLLNLLGRLSGIATLTRRYVEAVAGTKARIYDTRKTTPGWRRLEKYAVRSGGGWNHRTGLFEAILIKDNHLALGGQSAAAGPRRFTPAEAVVRARRFAAAQRPAGAAMIVEVEVDTLKQLDEVLGAGPDLVLLDNMTPDALREAVRRRDARGPGIELEASGGVDLAGVRRIAESGVDRISVGALTHSAVALDVGLDWLP